MKFLAGFRKSILLIEPCFSVSLSQRSHRRTKLYIYIYMYSYTPGVDDGINLSSDKVRIPDGRNLPNHNVLIEQANTVIGNERPLIKESYKIPAPPPDVQRYNPRHYGGCFRWLLPSSIRLQTGWKWGWVCGERRVII